jgi:hypothetical protein
VYIASLAPLQGKLHAFLSALDSARSFLVTVDYENRERRISRQDVLAYILLSYPTNTKACLRFFRHHGGRYRG